MKPTLDYATAERSEQSLAEYLARRAVLAAAAPPVAGVVCVVGAVASLVQAVSIFRSQRRRTP